MFGYIVPNQPEMKWKDYDVYQAYYCGVCRSLKKQYGAIGQWSLNYDMTFLAILLSGLYEPSSVRRNRHCLLHPVEKRDLLENVFSDYAADLSILFAYYKCEDDWKDERKVSGRLGKAALKCAFDGVWKKYPKKVSFVKEQLEEIGRLEQEKETSLDRISGSFGQIMAQIFVWKEDEWKSDLEKMGFYLGKFIYIMDAYDDLKKDEKEGNYNPLGYCQEREDFEAYCLGILKMMMAECCRHFERLPILLHGDILRNILYSGVWNRYRTIKGEQEKKEKQESVL